MTLYDRTHFKVFKPTLLNKIKHVSFVLSQDSQPITVTKLTHFILYHPTTSILKRGLTLNPYQYPVGSAMILIHTYTEDRL